MVAFECRRLKQTFVVMNKNRLIDQRHPFRTVCEICFPAMTLAVISILFALLTDPLMDFLTGGVKEKLVDPSIYPAVQMPSSGEKTFKAPRDCTGKPVSDNLRASSAPTGQPHEATTPYCFDHLDGKALAIQCRCRTLKLAGDPNLRTGFESYLRRHGVLAMIDDFTAKWNSEKAATCPSRPTTVYVDSDTDSVGREFCGLVSLRGDKIKVLMDITPDAAVFRSTPRIGSVGELKKIFEEDQVSVLPWWIQRNKPGTTVYDAYQRHAHATLQYFAGTFLAEYDSAPSLQDSTFSKIFNTPAVTIYNLPLPSRVEKVRGDTQVANFSAWFAFLMCFGLVMWVFVIVTALVREREWKQKEGMKVLGLSDVAFHASWVLYILMKALMVGFVMALFALLWPLSFTGFLVLLYSVTAALMQTFAFCSVMAIFFSNERTGAMMASMCYFLITIPAVVRDVYENPAVINILMLFPSYWATFALKHVIYMETMDWESGLQLDGFTTGYVIFFGFLATLGWWTLHLYLEQVVRQSVGRTRHPCFPCMPSFWREVCSKPAAKKDWSGAPPSPSMVGAATTDVEIIRACSAERAGNVEEVVDARLLAQRDTGRVVNISNLKVYFRGVHGEEIRAVDNLSMVMYTDEIFVLLGHNGAGKTTTIGVLTGLVQATGGSVTIMNKELPFELQQVRTCLGFCPQHNVLWDELTCFEHLVFFIQIRGGSRAAARDISLSTLQEVGLGPRSHYRSSELSGGMKRKLSCAIAFNGNPDFVILDEPTSGMDPFSRRVLWDFIKHRRIGRVVLLTTHFMDEADVLSERIAIMAHGKLQAYGDPQFLKRRFGCGYLITIVMEESGIAVAAGPGQRAPTASRPPGHAAAKANLPARSDQYRVPELGPTTTDLSASRAAIRARLKSNLESTAKGCKGVEVESVGKEMQVKVPFTESALMPNLFAVLDGARAAGDVATYGAAIASLEEVFLQIANCAAKHKDMHIGVNHASVIPEDDGEEVAVGGESVSTRQTWAPVHTPDIPSEYPRSPQPSTPRSPAGDSPLEDRFHTSTHTQDASDAPSRIISLGSQDGAPVPQDGEDGIPVDRDFEPVISLKTSAGVGLKTLPTSSQDMDNQCRALLVRRMRSAIRDRKTFAFVCGVAPLTLCIGCLFIWIVLNIIRNQATIFEKELRRAEPGRIIWGSPSGTSYPGVDPAQHITFTELDLQSVNLNRVNTTYDNDLQSNDVIFFRPKISADLLPPPGFCNATYNGSQCSRRWQQHVLLFADKIAERGGSYDAGVLSIDGHFSVWANSYALAHSVGDAVNVLINTLQTPGRVLKTTLGVVSLTPESEGLEINQEQSFLYIMPVILVSVAFSFIPTGVMIFIMMEKCSGAKSQLLISGCKYTAYWFTNLAWDAAFGLAPVVVGLLFFWIFDLKQFLKEALIVLYLMLCFIPASCGFAYVFSMIVSSENMATTIMLCINGLLGTTLVIMVLISDVISSLLFFTFAQEGGDVQKKLTDDGTIPILNAVHDIGMCVGMPLPGFSFAAGLLRISLRHMFSYSILPALFSSSLLNDLLNPVRDAAITSLSANTNIVINVPNVPNVSVPTINIPNLSNISVFIPGQASGAPRRAQGLQLGAISTQTAQDLANGFVNALLEGLLNSTFLGFSATGDFIYDQILPPTTLSMSLQSCFLGSDFIGPLSVSGGSFGTGESLFGPITVEIPCNFVKPRDAPSSTTSLGAMAESIVGLFVVGDSMIHMTILAVIWPLLAVLVDSMAQSPSLSSYFVPRDPVPLHLQSGALDPDVKAEQDRVAALSPEKQIILIRNLRRVYKRPNLKIYLVVAAALLTEMIILLANRSSFYVILLVNTIIFMLSLRLSRWWAPVLFWGVSHATHAVRGVSWASDTGMVLGLLGVNGAGKTSTFEMMAGLRTPSEGEVKICGLDVLTQVEACRRYIGYCPQFDCLIAHLTPIDHLYLFGRIKGLRGDQLKAAAEEKLSELQLDMYRDRYAGTLSGGNKRKLSVAIALIGEPPIVFLDEPSTGMDPFARRFMWKVIEDVAEKRKRSVVVLTTHSMEEGEALCSKVTIQVDGQLRCFGSVQQVKSRYGTGYEVPVKFKPVSEDIRKRESRALESHGLPIKPDEFLDRDQVLDTLGGLFKEKVDRSLRDGAPFGSGATTVQSQVFLDWWILDSSVGALSEFLATRDDGQTQTVTLVEHHGLTARFRLPNLQPFELGNLFGTLQANEALGIDDFSVCQSSLEAIFNRFASPEEDHKVDAPDVSPPPMVAAVVDMAALTVVSVTGSDDIHDPSVSPPPMVAGVDDMGTVATGSEIPNFSAQPSLSSEAALPPPAATTPLGFLAHNLEQI